MTLLPYDNVKIYHYAGTQHGPGTLPLTDRDGDARTTHPFNTVDYRPLLRAGLANLDRWVSHRRGPAPQQTSKDR